jgi:hypothetical protein
MRRLRRREARALRPLLTAIQQGRGEDLGHPSAVGGGVDVPDGGAVDGLAGLLHREPEPLRPLGPDQWGEPLRALRVDIHLLHARIVPGIAPPQPQERPGNAKGPRRVRSEAQGGLESNRNEDSSGG